MRLCLCLGLVLGVLSLAGCDKLPFFNGAKTSEGPYGYMGGGVRMTVPETWRITKDEEVNGTRQIFLAGPQNSRATIVLVNPGEEDPGITRFTRDFESRLAGPAGNLTLLSTSDLKRISGRQIFVQKLKREALGDEQIFLRYLERKRRGEKIGYTVFEFPLEAKEELGTDIAFIKAKLEYDEVRFQ